MSKLERDFDQAMLSIYQTARDEAGYSATLFRNMLMDRGGLATAKTLINASKPSDGYTALYERGRLDLTVEAMVVSKAKWHDLFLAEEVDRARKRLRAYGFVG